MLIHSSPISLSEYSISSSGEWYLHRSRDLSFDFPLENPRSLTSLKVSCNAFNSSFCQFGKVIDSTDSRIALKSSYLGSTGSS